MTTNAKTRAAVNGPLAAPAAPAAERTAGVVTVQASPGIARITGIAPADHGG